MKFSSILTAICKEYSLTLTDISNKLNVDKDEVIKWSEDKSVPSKEILEKISLSFILPMNLLEKAVDETKKDLN